MHRVSRHTQTRLRASHFSHINKHTHQPGTQSLRPASTNPAPTTIATSTTTVVVETVAASMPASKLDAQMSVSEAGATDEAFGPRTCSMAGPVGLKQMGVVDSAPSSRTVLPMLSRPALELLRSALAATMKFAAAASTTKRTAAQIARALTCHDHALREHEAVAPASRSRCMCSPSPPETAGSRTGGAAAVFSATAAAIALPR